MSAEIINADGALISVRISGKLTQPELAALQREVGDIIEQQGRVRLLVAVENFSGWQREGDWGDLSFQMDHDHDIERMAIVGDRKWKDLALIFTAKGVRKFPIEYFVPSENAKAQAWLGESVDKLNQSKS
jgi:hypothetical protein